MPAFPSPRFAIVKLLRHEFRTFEPGYRDFECSIYGGAQPAHKILGAQIATGRVTPGFSPIDSAVESKSRPGEAMRLRRNDRIGGQRPVPESQTG
jgi:hypothetical protein